MTKSTMTKSLEQLALRKELLQTRSALYRLKILHEFHAVRASLHWMQGGIKIATSLPVRSILFGLALQRVGVGRAARLLAIASRVLLFAKMTSIVVNMLRKPPIDPYRQETISDRHLNVVSIPARTSMKAR